MPSICTACLVGSSRSRARDYALCADRVSCLAHTNTVSKRLGLEARTLPLHDNSTHQLTSAEFEWDQGDEEMEGQSQEGDGDEGDADAEAEADGEGMEIEGAEDTTDEAEVVEFTS